MSKTVYRISNWKQYDRSLIKRGNLTLWFYEDTKAGWYAKNRKNKEPGRPPVYSDHCIEMALVLRGLFRFPLRATQGFLKGLM